jgi:hypothetical protein
MLKTIFRNKKVVMTGEKKKSDHVSDTNSEVGIVSTTSSQTEDSGASHRVYRLKALERAELLPSQYNKDSLKESFKGLVNAENIRGDVVPEVKAQANYDLLFENVPQRECDSDDKNESALTEVKQKRSFFSCCNLKLDCITEPPATSSKLTVASMKARSQNESKKDPLLGHGFSMERWLNPALPTILPRV